MTTFRHCHPTILAALLLLLPGIHAARAALILDVIVQPSAARAGEAGAFDVIVRDDPTSTQSVTLAGFSVDLTVPAAMGIAFTGINAGTSTPYLFAGNSLGFLATTLTALEASGNDFAASGGTALTPGGASFGLAHVTYTVAPNAAVGPVPVSLIGIKSGTSLSDTNFNNLDFTPTNGAITIAPSAVPEPSSLVLMVISGVILRLATLRPQRLLASH